MSLQSSGIPGAQEASDAIEVSVVVTTYNRAAGLAVALDGLVAQHVVPSLRYEIVVINDGSTDGTEALLEGLGTTSSLIRAISIPNSGVGHARDVGLRASRGYWIAFCDDDQIPSPEWLQSLYTVVTTHQAACAGGPVTLDLPPSCDIPLGVRARRLLGEDDFGTEVAPYPGGALPGTGNVIIRRDLLEQLGGFDGSFLQGGEDAELFHRVRAAGLSILYAPKALMRHVIPPARLRVEFLRWVAGRIGVAEARLDHKHKPVLAIVSRMVVRIAVLLTRDLVGAVSGEARRIEAACSAGYTTAYIRGSLHFLAPRLFPSETFIGHLNFRHHAGDRVVAEPVT